MGVFMWSFIIVCNLSTTNGLICSGSSGVYCCIGYSWNTFHNSCEPCKIGYHGENCDEPCPYPFYGENCQSQCICGTNESCHHDYGCKTNKRDFTTMVGRSKTTSRETPHVTKDCNMRQNQTRYPGIFMTVICLTAISGIFLVLYIGLHFYITKYQQVYPFQATAIV